MAQEESFTLRFGPQQSKWKVKLENTLRKNSLDSFASYDYLKDETMPTNKRSVGLQYSDMTEDTYKKMDIEFGLPINRGTSSFFKIDAFITKSSVILKDKLKLVWLL